MDEKRHFINPANNFIFKEGKESMDTHEYNNGEITILWKPNLCIHSGICVKTLPKVYDPQARPWIRLENATTQELLDQVAKCPSGALSIIESELNNEYPE